MKIAMIGQKGLPATYGGIERHVEEIAQRLVRKGHDVTVYCRHDYTPQDEDYLGIHLQRTWSRNTKHLGTATHVLSSTWNALFRDYDIVHFHALGPAAFALFPRLRGSRTVATIHGLDWQREKWGPKTSWVLRQCEIPAVHFPSRTIVVSHTLQRYFREHHGRETVYVPNGTNIPEPVPPQHLSEFGLEPGKYALFVGRLVPEKGVHYLLDAFQEVQTDCKLAIAGGYAFTPDYQKKLESYASDRIRFLGYIFDERLNELWSNAKLVVLPSTLEGLSIALLEALSFGRCVLMSDIPENLEVAGNCAMTFRSKNVADLREKMQTLLDDPELIRSYETRSRDHVRAHFSWDHITDLTERVYLDLMKG